MRAKRKDVCQTCRSRKLACDGKQPACSQCILRRVPCSGYKQEFVFVAQASFEVANQADMKHESKGVRRYQKEAFVKPNDDHARPIRNSPLATPVRMAQLEMRSYEFEDDVQVILQHYAPINSNAPAESNSCHNQICGAWVEVLPLLSGSIRKKQFLFSAIKTLAATLRHHKLRNELHQAQILKMYGDSLALMGKALEEARGAFHIEHSAAIMCLAVTDIIIPTFESTLESGWMMHIKGVGDLAERLGPEPFSSGILHTLFIGFRPLLLISSIARRQKTFLAREEWTTIPFGGQPGSIMQLLLNQASDIPALLERYHSMVDLEDVSKIVAAEQLQKDFQKILESLHEWKLMLHSRALSPVFWSKPNIGDSLSSDEDVLWFPNIMTANSLTHCWAFEIIARRHLTTLDGAISTAKGYSQLEIPRTLSSFSEESVVVLAEMICSSMPYLMQPDMKSYGPGSAFFTLPTAVQVFQGEPDRYTVQLDRCQQILSQFASIGFHFPRVIR